MRAGSRKYNWEPQGCVGSPGVLTELWPFHGLSHQLIWQGQNESSWMDWPSHVPGSCQLSPQARWGLFKVDRSLEPPTCSQPGHVQNLYLRSLQLLCQQIQPAPLSNCTPHSSYCKPPATSPGSCPVVSLFHPCPYRLGSNQQLGGPVKTKV